MKMKDSFLNRLQPLEDFPKLFENKERFGDYNENTLGFLLVSKQKYTYVKQIFKIHRLNSRCCQCFIIFNFIFKIANYFKFTYVLEILFYYSHQLE